MRQTASALALAAILAAEVGCGESTLTRAELSAQATAICNTVIRDAQRIAAEEGFGQRASAGRDPKEAARRVVRRFQERLRQAVIELRALAPPAELQGAYDRFTSHVAEISELQSAISNDERPGEARLARIRAEQERITARLRVRSCHF